MFEQFGWKGRGDGFLLGERLHLATGGIAPSANLSPDLKRTAYMLSPATGGNAKDWTSAANTMFGATSIEQGFLLLSSFASPIWAMRPKAKRGYFAALSGGKKTGKTTAMLAAATVWGDPEGITMRSRDDMKDRFTTISQLSDLPIIGSSLVNKDPDVVQGFVKHFVDGPKNLPRYYGIMSPWCNVMLYEGTVSLGRLLGPARDDLMASGFELEARLDPEFQDKKKGRLETLLMANSGHAGEIFIRYLVKQNTQKWTRGAVNRWITRLSDGYNTPDTMTNRIEFLACIMVAATIVSKLGLLELSVERLQAHALAEADLILREVAPLEPVLPPE